MIWEQDKLTSTKTTYIFTYSPNLYYFHPQQLMHCYKASCVIGNALVPIVSAKFIIASSIAAVGPQILQVVFTCTFHCFCN